MQILGKAILAIICILLIGAGLVAVWYSSVLFQQNMQSLATLRKFMGK